MPPHRWTASHTQRASGAAQQQDNPDPAPPRCRTTVKLLPTPKSCYTFASTATMTHNVLLTCCTISTAAVHHTDVTPQSATSAAIPSKTPPNVNLWPTISAGPCWQHTCVNHGNNHHSPAETVCHTAPRGRRQQCLQTRDSMLLEDVSTAYTSQLHASHSRGHRSTPPSLTS